MDILLIIPLLVGLGVGLLVNYLGDVLPITRSFSRPACQTCGAEIALKDYLLFRACAHGHKRSLRAWLTIIFVITISLYAWQAPPKIGYALGMVVIGYFGLVFVIDLEHRLILHPTSIFGMFLGISVGIIRRGLTATLFGGLGGLAIMLAFYYLGVLFSRMRANKLRAAGEEADDEEALGAGDVILVTVLGLMLGWPVIWFGVLAGILIGGAVSLLLLLWLLVTGRYSKNSLMIFIPYGPYFITSAFMIIFFPDLVSLLLP
ncbi:MAG: prepilin peptidase [Anaerolineales bacterium]|nr:prepilin peptidase [Anaerolineales bacterium]